MRRSKQECVETVREAVILSLLLSAPRYGVDIQGQYECRAGAAMPPGSLYVILGRLEGKGLVRSRVGRSEGKRGGNYRRYYKITTSGARALAFVRNAVRE